MSGVFEMGISLLPCMEWLSNFLPARMVVTKRAIERVPRPYTELTHDYMIKFMSYGAIIGSTGLLPFYRWYMTQFHPDVRYQRYRSVGRNIMRGTFYVTSLAGPLYMLMRVKYQGLTEGNAREECIELRKDPSFRLIHTLTFVGALAGSVSHRLPGLVHGACVGTLVGIIATKVYKPKPSFYCDDLETRHTETSPESLLESPIQQEKQWTKHLFNRPYQYRNDE